VVGVKLSEAELIALRDEAQAVMLRESSERLRWYDPEKCDRTPDEVIQRATDLMLAASEVYGALRNEELAFSAAKGLPGPAEWVEVGFTEKALGWMKQLRKEIRGMLDDQRGSCEIGLDATPRETFLLFVLDGIFANDGEDS